MSYHSKSSQPKYGNGREEGENLRRSNMSSPISVEIILIPDEKRVTEAMHLAAPGYRRALIQKIKDQEEPSYRKKER